MKKCIWSPHEKIKSLKSSFMKISISILHFISDVKNLKTKSDYIIHIS